MSDSSRRNYLTELFRSHDISKCVSKIYLVKMFLIVFLRLENTTLAYIFTVWMLVIVAESQRRSADFGQSELKES